MNNQANKFKLGYGRLRLDLIFFKRGEDSIIRVNTDEISVQGQINAQPWQPLDLTVEEIAYEDTDQFYRTTTIKHFYTTYVDIKTVGEHIIQLKAPEAETVTFLINGVDD